MKFFDFFKRAEKRERGPDGWQPMPGTLFAQSPESAESLSTVYACVTAISSAISALPALLYQNFEKTRSEVIFGDFYRLLKAGPNPWQSWPEFVEMLVAETLLRGNGLIEIVTDRQGSLTELHVIPWAWVNVQMLASGRLVYDVFDAPGIFSPAQGKRRRLLQGDVIHIRDRSDDGVIGKSRLQRAAPVLRNAQAVNSFATAILENGLHPSSLLTSERDLTSEAMAEVRRAFESSHLGASKAGKMMILPGGNFSYHRLTISPEDAELLESRKFSTEEICRLFQVPPPIIQDYAHNTFTNSEAAARWFAQFCLLPWVRKIEAAFNKSLFEGTNFELVLDMSSFDRGDPTTRWQNHAIAASNGILTIDEIREVEGWAPLERDKQN